MIEVHGENDMKRLGARLGTLLLGGEVIELVGDVGAGKTTFVKGLAEGLRIDDDVQSPSFTISRSYDARDGLRLMHYDFYRLDDPGIMAADLDEATQDPTTVTVVEWADIASDVLPTERLTLTINSPQETVRRIDIQPNGNHASRLAEAMA